MDGLSSSLFLLLVWFGFPEAKLAPIRHSSSAVLKPTSAKKPSNVRCFIPHSQQNGAYYFKRQRL
jgi:hypothetical protein